MLMTTLTTSSQSFGISFQGQVNYNFFACIENSLVTSTTGDSVTISSFKPNYDGKFVKIYFYDSAPSNFQCSNPPGNYYCVSALLNFGTTVPSRYYKFETRKNYSFYITTTDPSPVQISEVYYLRQGNKTTCNSSCSLYFDSTASGTIYTYLKNDAGQIFSIDQFNYEAISGLQNPRVTAYVGYNTSSNKTIDIPSTFVPSVSTTFNFYNFSKSPVTSSAYYYETSSIPSTDISTTTADVRKVYQYLVSWRGENVSSCSISFSDYNNNQSQTSLFNNTENVGFIFVTTSPSTTFREQQGKYNISCSSDYQYCSLSGSILNCSKPDNIATVYINTSTDITWYRCFFGFCIGSREKKPKYIYPTWDDCVQSCYLDIREISP